MSVHVDNPIFKLCPCDQSNTVAPLKKAYVDPWKEDLIWYQEEFPLRK